MQICVFVCGCVCMHACMHPYIYFQTVYVCLTIMCDYVPIQQQKTHQTCLRNCFCFSSKTCNHTVLVFHFLLLLFPFFCFVCFVLFHSFFQRNHNCCPSCIHLRYHICTVLMRLIFFCSCSTPYNSASAVGGHPVKYKHTYINNNYLTHICVHTSHMYTHTHTHSLSLSHTCIHTHTHTQKHTCI